MLPISHRRLRRVLSRGGPARRRPHPPRLLLRRGPHRRRRRPGADSWARGSYRLDRVVGIDDRGLLGVVLRQEAEQLLRDQDGLLVVVGNEVDDTGAAHVGVGTAEGVLGDFFARDLLDHARARGLVAILAHTFSCFISFKGGKGVATSLGVFLFLIPVITLILLAIFILVAYFTRYISLASITAAFLLPIFTFFTHRDSYLFALSVIIAIFVIYRHKTNISRLLSGTENKFKF